MKLFVNVVLGVVILSCLAMAQNQTMQNEIVNMHACGLDYVQQSIKLTRRDSLLSMDGHYTPGNSLPVTISITGIPTECTKIEKAYILMTYSNQLDTAIKKYNDTDTLITPRFKFQVINNTSGTQAQYLSTIIATGKKNGWGEIDDKGKVTHRLDVTDNITGNGNYTINLSAEDYYMKYDKEKSYLDFVDGITMIVIYRKLDAKFQGHLIINDGLIVIWDDLRDYKNIEFDLKNMDVCEATNDARAFMLVSDLQTTTSANATWTFNGIERVYPRKFWNFEVENNISLAQNQNKYTFGLAPEAGHTTPDMYSIVAGGIYYRTLNCFNCSESFDMSLQSTSNSICPGEEIEIEAIIPEEYASEPIKYLWSSIPPGFTSTEKTIKVKPTQTTKYLLEAEIVPDCLKSSSEITVNLNPVPIANAGTDVKLCGIASEAIGQIPESGTPPFTYEWHPAKGLSDSTLMSPLVSGINSEMTYYLKVTDANGCSGYDTVKAFVYELPVPEIMSMGKIDMCHCDSTVITAKDDFDKYLWNTGDTTKSITVRQAGSYFVTVTDKNLCFNTSAPIEVTTYIPKTTVSLNDTLIYAKLGDIIEIPLKLTSTTHLEDCGLKNYQAKISFNRSVLVPVSGTPFGEIIEPDRIITVSGSKDAANNLLQNMKFQVVLGNTDFVKVRLNSFDWLECSGEIQKIDSAVKVIDLCYEGGTRLFNSSIPLPQPKQNYPNPFSESTSIEFGIFETCSAKILISDMLGRIIRTYDYPNIEPGSYILNLNAIDFTAGNYIYTLKIGEKEYHRLMRITGK